MADYTYSPGPQWCNVAPGIPSQVVLDPAALMEIRLEKLERQFRILVEKILGQRKELPPEFCEYVAGGKK